MGVSKVEYDGRTIIDLTSDTVTEDTLIEGVTAHDAAGNEITGKATPGVTSHTQLTDRDADEQHPISAIAGLHRALTDIKLVGTAAGNTIALTDSATAPIEGLTLYGKTTQNGTPSPTTPAPLVSAGDSGEINVTVARKNLVDVFSDKMNLGRAGNDYDYPSYTHIEYINKIADDGTVTVDISGSNTYGLGFTKKLFAGQTVTLSFNVISVGTSGNGLTCVIYDTANPASAKKSLLITTIGMFSTQFTADADSTYMFGWYVSGGTQPCGARFGKLQLELGSIATDYEPYKEVQNHSVQTPNGLLGIPVASGGNYTDESGQQWICDEIDFDRGVYVKRIKYLLLDGDETLGAETSGGYKRFWLSAKDADLSRRTNVLSSHFAGGSIDPGYSRCCITADGYLVLYVSDTMQNYDAAAFKAWLSQNPITVQYALATTTETSLSAVEIAAFKALHTNKQTTTILTDSGADMKVTYVPDNPSASFLADRLRQIETTILSLGGNV